MEDYLKLLRKIYDFNSLSTLLHRPDFKFAFDGMHGVAGPYAKRIFVEVFFISLLPPPLYLTLDALCVGMRGKCISRRTLFPLLPHGVLFIRGRAL